jgi:hypothetical protein
MNRLYRLPLRTRAKNLSSGVRRRQTSSKILTTGILAICALALVVAIGFAGVFTFRHMMAKPKVIAAATSSPGATPSSAASPLKPKEILLPLSDPNNAPSAATASSSPSVSPPLSPSVLTSIAAPTPAASVAQHEQKTDSQPKENNKTLTKSERKVLEKKRLEAERKRARLEQMYQNHEISTEAYNKGKEEYKVEIQKYRNDIKSAD